MSELTITITYLKLEGQYEALISGGWWVGRGDTKKLAAAKAIDAMLRELELEKVKGSK